MNKEEEVKHLLSQLAPDQRAAIEAHAMLKIEHQAITKQFIELKASYDDLWKIFITLLHAQPEQELRIHSTQFLRFKEEYRIDRSYDESAEEVVFKLLTVMDDVDDSSGD